MKVLIVIGRLHPNLTEWVEAFRQEGHSVTVIVGRESVNKVERVQPRIIPPDEIDQAAAQKIVDLIQPDLVIIRSKDEGHRRIVKVAKKRGAAAIYYDQRPYLRPRGFRAVRRELSKALERAWIGHPRVGITTTRGKGDVPRLWRHWVRVPMPVWEGAEQRPYFRDGVPTVLLVGRLANQKKRHAWVLNALEEFGGPYRLLVAGAGDDSHTAPGKRSRDYYEQVRATLNAPQVKDRVQLLEDVPHERMTELYQQADIFVLPSTKELLGISIVEAMGHGCAVLASSGAGATGYMTQDEDGLIFERDSYEAFRDGLHALLSDQGMVRRLGQRAADTIRERHRHADFVKHIRRVAGR
ncbi:MAG: glycosyltransferase family 4 protein [Ectothiorhodospiraceae bacterium]|nr:glycosyltransferase family 4 protein [Ectothiorhodospiraceae bacterium]MCH8503377.1 glycosyltransferase family 4 protein [Ectothiorhodospiraceae bacterium]